MHTTTSPETDAQRIASALIAVLTGLKNQMGRTGHDFAPAFVLYRVSQHGPVRVSDLATGCGLDASTVSRHVKTLEDQGFVERAGDPQDRRASRVGLTDLGREYIANHNALRARLLGDALIDWSAEDRTQYLDLTERLAASLTPNPSHTLSEQS